MSFFSKNKLIPFSFYKIINYVEINSNNLQERRTGVDPFVLKLTFRKELKPDAFK